MSEFQGIELTNVKEICYPHQLRAKQKPPGKLLGVLNVGLLVQTKGIK
jgi:hypothetical protein